MMRGYGNKNKKRVRTKRNQRIAKKYVDELTKRLTPAEKKFASILDGAGIRYIPQHVFMRGKTFAIVDFWLPNLGLVVEIDGGYHGTVEQQKKDAIRTSDLLRKSKITAVTRFTNDEVLDPRSDVLKDLLLAVAPWAKQYLKD